MIEQLWKKNVFQSLHSVTWKNIDVILKIWYSLCLNDTKLKFLKFRVNNLSKVKVEWDFYERPICQRDWFIKSPRLAYRLLSDHWRRMGKKIISKSDPFAFFRVKYCDITKLAGLVRHLCKRKVAITVLYKKILFKFLLKMYYKRKLKRLQCYTSSYLN